MTTTNESTQSPPVAGSGRLSTLQRMILAIVLIADVLDLMDSTITNIAAPTIVRDIGGGESLIKWLGASYALAMGGLLVVGGRLGDRYGKRRLFLIGMAGFTLASVWCGLSVDPAMLIAGRLLQGSFGALLIPQGIGILLGTLSREQLPRAFGLFGPVMGASAIDVALGDVAPAEAGSASGALSAVPQLAAAIGSAVVTTVYFSQRAHQGAAHAMTVSVAVVGAIALLDLGLVWLLPKSAPPEQH